MRRTVNIPPLCKGRSPQRGGWGRSFFYPPLPPLTKGGSIACLLIVLLLTSCATLPGKRATPKPGATSQSTVVREPGEPPREVMTPIRTDYAAVQSPKRQVSTQLVAQGKEFLAKRDYEQARNRLEEAVSVDPTNGAAYYHLAVVYYDLKDYPKALGFLDQAEALFHNSPEWMETIQRFRELMR